MGSGSPGAPTKVPLVDPRSSTYQRSRSRVSGRVLVGDGAVTRAVEVGRQVAALRPASDGDRRRAQRHDGRRATRRAATGGVLVREPLRVDPELGDPVGARSRRRCRRPAGRCRGRQLAGGEVVPARLRRRARRPGSRSRSSDTSPRPRSGRAGSATTAAPPPTGTTPGRARPPTARWRRWARRRRRRSRRCDDW